MKVTKRQLRRIIKEEKQKLISEAERVSFMHTDLLDELRQIGISDTQILEHILFGGDVPAGPLLEALYTLRERPGRAAPAGAHPNMPEQIR